MPSKNPEQRFQDIIDNIDLARSFAPEQDKDKFDPSSKEFNAVSYCMLRISEAATKLGMLAEQLEPNIDWRGIRDIGNVLRHEYDMVNPAIIWKVLHTDFPPLETACRSAIERLETSRTDAERAKQLSDDLDRAREERAQRDRDGGRDR